MASAPASSSVTPPSQPLEFREAKRQLRKLYATGNHRTLYAGCSFARWSIDWRSCCYPLRDTARARLEWEHVVPASAFGREFASWKQGDARCVDSRGHHFYGRRCARIAAKRFRLMEGDMHNLYPTIGAINEARADFPMAIIDGESRRFGSCDVELAGRSFEPPSAARGEIARAYLYMDASYPGFNIVPAEARAMFDSWHREDPPDDWERRRNAYIAGVQGNHNPFIEPARDGN